MLENHVRAYQAQVAQFQAQVKELVAAVAQLRKRLGIEEELSCERSRA
jgi:hypothetical protein